MALHLINILARCSFVSDTNLHSPSNGFDLTGGWLGFSFSCIHSLTHLFHENTHTHNEYVIFDELISTGVCWFNLCHFSFTSTLFSHMLFLARTQIGYLDVVIPPDFIAEDTSSDVIVPEGSSVKLTCRFVAFFINFILLFPPWKFHRIISNGCNTHSHIYKCELRNYGNYTPNSN